MDATSISDMEALILETGWEARIYNAGFVDASLGGGRIIFLEQEIRVGLTAWELLYGSTWMGGVSWDQVEDVLERMKAAALHRKRKS